MNPFSRTTLSQCLAAPLLIAFAVAAALPAHADQASELSEASAIPIGVSLALPVMLVAGVGSVVVRSVDASADGVGWVVENAVDGSRATVRCVGRAAGASAVGVGTVITVTTIGAGLMLSAAGQVVAFIPNEIGKSLLYTRQVSQ